MRADAGSGAPAVFKPNAAGDAIIPEDTSDSWVVGSDRMGRDPADASKDIRAFFNKAKGAFRVGATAGSMWDDVLVGANSFAYGLDPTASGYGAFAGGRECEATSSYSWAAGYKAKSTSATAHAEGHTTTASGGNSHAEGIMTTASGGQSHAEGSSTLASGNESHAEGYSTTASGLRSHAEGAVTTASGFYAHSEGSTTTASGSASHAEGHFTTSFGQYSHAEGSHAHAARFGQHAKASGRFVNFGDAQVSEFVVRRETTDAAPSVLNAVGTQFVLADGSNQTNVLTLTPNRTHKFRVDVAARRTDAAGEAAGWSFEGVVARDATGNARIVGAITTNKWNDTAAAAWDVAVTVDTTNNYLAITATGEAGKTIRWVAELNTVEVG